jgi:hypothetical protein
MNSYMKLDYEFILYEFIYMNAYMNNIFMPKAAAKI